MSPETIQHAEREELARRRREVDRLLEDPRIAAHGDLVLRLRARLTAARTYVDQELARREQLLHKTRRVRELQRAYFRTRDRTVFAAAKRAERELDHLIAPQVELPLEEVSRA